MSYTFTMANNNRNEQQQQQQQQQQPQRTLNPYSDSFTFNPSPYYNNNSSNSNIYYNPNAQAQAQAQAQQLTPSNLYSNNTEQPLINNYYQLQQQQQLYQPPPQQQQPQQQTYTHFQTYVPPQPPSLQPFNDPIIPTEPDEFILDLLKKPQERLFLLKLELEIEAFIKEESKLRLDFPGMNSYQRLMVHRLAPYYKLNHFHDAMRKAVYVCRTFITALPAVRLQDVRLTDNEEPNSNNDTTDTPSTTTNNPAQEEASEQQQQQQPTPQFKIMRRSAGSSPNSRNASESAENSKEINRKNMTFEERKTAYEEARARIFQNLESSSSSSPVTK